MKLIFSNYNKLFYNKTVAVAATWHSMTHIILEMMKTVRITYPDKRLFHNWEIEKPTNVENKKLLMNVTDGCIEDIQSMFLELVIPCISDIVG